MAEDIKRDKNTTDKQIADATRVTNVVNSLRTDLIQEIDEKLNEMVGAGKLQKLYKQGSTKMYGK
jgi:predicted lactoylglutathione lyase